MNLNNDIKYKLLGGISVNSKEEIKKLELLCIPIIKYLNKNYDPYCEVVITNSRVRLIRDELGILVQSGD